MKKYLLIIIIFLSFLNSYSQEAVEKNIFLENLKGNIKEIKEKQFSKNITHKPKLLVYNFNSKGNLIELDDYYDTITLYKKRICIYDESQNLIEIKQDFPNKVMQTIAKYKYDSKKNLIEKDFVYKKYIYNYNSENKIIEEKSFYEDGSLCFKNSLKYSKNKKVAFCYDSENKLLLKIEHFFNQENKEIKTINYFADGKTIKSTNNFKYDKLGNIIEYNPFFNESIIVKYEYVYDKIGNWIKRIELQDNNTEEIIEREIIYI